jgi:V/A-type H+-transporting ATPase subunit I
MIERMKKISLFVSAKEQDALLSALRKHGSLHVQNLEEVTAQSLDRINKEIHSMEKASEVCGLYAGGGTAHEDGREYEGKIVEEARQITHIWHDTNELTARAAALDAEKEWFGDWGDVDPEDITRLRERGVNIKLYRLRISDFDKLGDKGSMRVVKKCKKDVCVMFLGGNGEEGPGFEEEPMPARSRTAIETEAGALAKEIQEKEEALKTYAATHKALLKAAITHARKRLEFLTVKEGMKAEGPITVIQGYCPQKRAANIIDISAKCGAGYVIEDPQSGEEVPTFVTNPRWLEMIKPIFTLMNIMPGYNEFDMSGCLLVFFGLFFAMLVGDAGYGIIFLSLTVFARRKMKNVPPQPFFLMYVLSVGTIVWGAISGTWFGSAHIAKLPFFSDLIVGKLDSFAEESGPFIMRMCFVIGAVHLSVAHFIKVGRAGRSPAAIADIGWVLVIWGMFFTAQTVILDKPFPGCAKYFLCVGIIAVLVFANFQRNVFKGMMATMIDLPLGVIGAFSDVVSYLRLFAIGYAGVVISSSFNDMILGSAKGFFGGLAAAILLFFAHTLNIILSGMAVIVHGLRLNILEFSSHLGMQWTGKEYRPFTE